MSKGKKFLKRSFCIILAAALTMSLASCKKNKQGNAGNVSGLVAQASDASTSKDYTYRLDKELNLGDDVRNVEKILTDGNQLIYFIPSCDGGIVPDDFAFTDEDLEGTSEEVTSDSETAKTEETSEETNKEDANGEEANGEETDGEGTDGEDIDYEGMISEAENITAGYGWRIGDISGNVGDRVVLNKEYPTNASFSVKDAQLLSDGTMGILTSLVSVDDGSESYSFTKASLDGKIISEKDIDFKALKESSAACVCADGSLVIYVDSNFVLFDSDLKKSGEIPAGNLEYVFGIFSSNDGRLFVYYMDSSYNSKVSELVVSGQKMEALNLDENIISAMHANPNHTLESKTTKGVYAIDINGSNAETKMLMNFSDSDVIGSTVNRSMAIDDETIVLVGHYDNDEIQGIFKKVPPEEVKDKIIITMGSIYSVNYKVQKHILDFNRTSDQYKIRTVDYEQYYSDDDFAAPEKQFRNDILSGMGPDIIITANMLNPKVYMNKNVFEDLYPYFDKNGINRDDYLQNILDAGSQDGKLYQVFPSFTIMSIEMKESILEGKKGLTMQELIDLEKKYDCVGKGIVGETRDQLLTECLAFTADSYFDTSTGECHFDSEEFINTLKWINNYPTEEEQMNGSDDYFEYMRNKEMALHKNESLMTIGYMYDLRDIKRDEEVLFGDKIALTGFPGAKDNASGLINVDLGFAINAKSPYKDAAFDFIKYYLTDEYQDPDEEYNFSFPSKKSSFGKLLDFYKGKPYNLDEKGNKQYYDNTGYSYTQGKEITVSDLTDDDLNEIREYVTSCSLMMTYDKKITEIVTEEAAAYFSGQKSAEDVAAIIQNRVTNYVRENQ